jgi:hypothetical protein
MEDDKYEKLSDGEVLILYFLSLIFKMKIMQQNNY